MVSLFKRAATSDPLLAADAVIGHCAPVTAKEVKVTLAHSHMRAHVCCCTLPSGPAWPPSSETGSPERRQKSCRDAVVPLMSSKDGTSCSRLQVPPPHLTEVLWFPDEQ